MLDYFCFVCFKEFGKSLSCFLGLVFFLYHFVFMSDE